MKMERRSRLWSRVSARWVGYVQQHARATLIMTGILTFVILMYSITGLRLNMDMSGMISEKLPFRQVEQEFNRAFPNLANTLVLVIEAETAEVSLNARDRIADALKTRPDLFRNMYVPGGGSFFYRNGLLYLSPDELQDFSDNMAAMQPFIALLSKDLSLPGFFSILRQLLDQSDVDIIGDKRIDLLFAELARQFQNEGRDRHIMPWSEIMLGEKEGTAQRKQFIIVQPPLDRIEAALNAVRETLHTLGLDREPGLRVSMTGDVVLNEETLREVRSSVGIATIVSFLLVALILYVGLHHSPRLIAASLITLAVGLIWTLGFAVIVIGSLNMISITFAVLFIGLGIDYSIQFCLRFRELVVCRAGVDQRLIMTSQGTGRGLLFSCLTTAIGFYSFLPTAYAGVAELGLISGTGMFISFVGNMTVLPAILKVMHRSKRPESPDTISNAAVTVPYRFPRVVVITAALLCAGAAVLLPKVYFDFNPLNLYNPKSPAIITIRGLFLDPQSTPWTISVLAKDSADAKHITEKLRTVPEVNMVITVFDFIPDDQPEKMQIISDIRLFMPELTGFSVHQASCDQDRNALEALGQTVHKTARARNNSPALQHLDSTLSGFLQLRKKPSEQCSAFRMLEQNILSTLPPLLDRLMLSLDPRPIRLQDLPRELVEQYVSSNGRYRVQVFPRENILERASLARFVNSVTSTVPNATDTPVIIYESGLAVIASFRNAVMLACIAIIIVLLFEMRLIRTTFLILIPLIVALLLTGACSVLFGFPLNFANVIVVPLLLGVGVHNGILFTIRYRTEPPVDGNMLRTSTVRGILFSSLTMMISTGSLAFSAHRGILSIGVLLTVAFFFLMITTLMLMPALFALFQKGRR